MTTDIAPDIPKVEDDGVPFLSEEPSSPIDLIKSINKRYIENGSSDHLVTCTMELPNVFAYLANNSQILNPSSSDLESGLIDKEESGPELLSWLLTQIKLTCFHNLPQIRVLMTERIFRIVYICFHSKSEALYNSINEFFFPLLVDLSADEIYSVRNATHNCFHQLLDMGLMEPSFIEMRVFPVIYNFLENSEPNASADCFLSLLKLSLKLDQSFVKNSIIPVFHLFVCGTSSFSLQSDTLKNCAGAIGDLGLLCPNNITLLRCFNSLTQSSQYTVRRFCCESLGKFSKCFCTAVRWHIFPKFLYRLIHDESHWVQKAAFNSIGPLIGIYASTSKTGLMYVFESDSVIFNKELIDIDCVDERASDDFPPNVVKELVIEFFYTPKPGGDQSKSGNHQIDSPCAADDWNGPPYPRSQNLQNDEEEDDDVDGDHEGLIPFFDPTENSDDDEVWGPGLTNPDGSNASLQQNCDDDIDKEFGNATFWSVPVKPLPHDGIYWDTVLKQASERLAKVDIGDSSLANAPTASEPIDVPLAPDSGITSSKADSDSPDPEEDDDEGILEHLPVIAENQAEESDEVASGQLENKLLGDFDAKNRDEREEGEQPGAMNEHGSGDYDDTVEERIALILTPLPRHSRGNGDEAAFSPSKQSDEDAGPHSPPNSEIDEDQDLASVETEPWKNLSHAGESTNENSDPLEAQGVCPDFLLSKFVTFLDLRDIEVSYHAAFSLPAITLCLGRRNWFRLRSIYSALSKESPWRTRRTVAFSVIRMSEILGDELTLKDVKPVFDQLCKDVDEVKIGVLKNFAQFVKKMPTLELKTSYLPLLDEFTKTDSPYNWRLVYELGHQLYVLVTEFPCASITYDVFARLAFKLVSDEFRPMSTNYHIRLTAARVIAQCLKHLNILKNYAHAAEKARTTAATTSRRTASVSNSSSPPSKQPSSSSMNNTLTTSTSQSDLTTTSTAVIRCGDATTTSFGAELANGSDATSTVSLPEKVTAPSKPTVSRADDVFSKIMVALRTQFCKSPTYWRRQFFLYVCLWIAQSQAIPPSQFVQHLLVPALSLAHDPVPIVRVLVSRLIHHHIFPVSYFTKDTNPYHESVASVAHLLACDPDPDVREASILKESGPRLHLEEDP